MADESGLRTPPLDDGQSQTTAPSELSTMIDALLNDLTAKFTAVSSEILVKMDDMSRRIDNLESSLQNPNPTRSSSQQSQSTSISQQKTERADGDAATQ